MKNLPTRQIAMAALICAAGAAWVLPCSAATLYGVVGVSETCMDRGCTDVGKLVRFGTSLQETVGDTGLQNLRALAFDPINRRLVAGAENGRIYELDAETAAPTLLVSQLLADPDPPAEVQGRFSTPAFLTTLEYHPVTGDLFGVVADFSGTYILARIDLAAADASRRVAIDIIGVIGSDNLAFTGERFGFTNVMGIAFDANGQLYGTGIKWPNDPPGPYLITINTTPVPIPGFASEVRQIVTHGGEHPIASYPRAMALAGDHFVLSGLTNYYNPGADFWLDYLFFVWPDGYYGSGHLVYFDGQVTGLARFVELSELPARPPTITSFHPPGGNAGIVVNIRGAGFSANGNSNVEAVYFNGIAAYGAPVVESDSSLYVMAPMTTTGPIKVVAFTDTNADGAKDEAVSRDDFVKTDLGVFEAEFNQGMATEFSNIGGYPVYPLIAGKDTLVRLLTASDDQGVPGPGPRPVTFGTANLRITKPSGAETNVAGTYYTRIFSNLFYPDRVEPTHRHNINFFVSGDELDEAGSYQFSFTVTAYPRNPGDPDEYIYASQETRTLSARPFADSHKVLVVLGGIMDGGNFVGPDEASMAGIFKAFDEMSRVWPIKNGVGRLGEDLSAGIRWDFAPSALVVGTQLGKFVIADNFSDAAEVVEPLLDAYNEANSDDAYKVAVFLGDEVRDPSTAVLGQAEYPGEFSISTITGDRSYVPIHELGHNSGIVWGDYSINALEDDDLHSHNQHIFDARDARYVRFFNIPDRYTLTTDSGYDYPASLMFPSAGGLDGETFFESVEYFHLIQQPVVHGTGFALGQAVAPQSTAPVMTVIARIHRAGAAEILHSYVSQSEKPLTATDPTSPHSLAFLDSAGRVLAEDRFGVSFTAGVGEHTQTEASRVTVTLARPLPSGTAAVQVREDGAVLASLPRSGSSPTLTKIVAPGAGQVIGVAESVPLSWEAVDPDGGSLTYSVSYSPNPDAPPEAVRWLPIVSGTGDSAIVWRTQFAPGTVAGRLRFTVSDGFNTGSVLSGVFAVQQKPPMASILHPTNGQRFLQYDSIVLRALVFDLQSGLIDGGGIQWLDESGAPLGTGRRVVLEPNVLSPGTHVITMRASDAGAIVTKSVSITVIADSDGDGLSDEFENGYESQDPLEPYDAGQDVDGDGLSSLMEATFGTNPENPDSDGDGVSDGSEIATGRDPTNRPPVCNAGPSTSAECSGLTTVHLDGTSSFDLDGDPLTFAWAGPFTDRRVFGETVDVRFSGTGTFEVVLEVNDGKETTRCTTTATIVDTVPPGISVVVAPSVLWPPNHKMIAISTQVVASDVCDSSARSSLTSITQTEGDLENTYDAAFDNTVGDGNTLNDIMVDQYGKISLRAERSGKGSGREYTIRYSAGDASGNSAEGSARVTVPHSQ